MTLTSQIEGAITRPSGASYAALRKIADALLHEARVDAYADPLHIARFLGYRVEEALALPGDQLAIFDTSRGDVRVLWEPDRCNTGLHAHLALALVGLHRFAPIVTEVTTAGAKLSTVVRLAHMIGLPDGFDDATERAAQVHLPDRLIAVFQTYRQRARFVAAASKSGTFAAVAR